MTVDPFLLPTPFMDADHPEILTLVQSLDLVGRPSREKAIALFEFVRDHIRYDWMAKGQASSYVASGVLAAGQGFCVQKAVLLCALGRAAGIPTALVLSDLEDWQLPDRYVQAMGHRMIFSHGLAAFRLDGAWRKVDPALSPDIVALKRFRPVVFDGLSDALHASTTLDGAAHARYARFHGQCADLDFDSLMETYRTHYQDKAFRVFDPPRTLAAHLSDPEWRRTLALEWQKPYLQRLEEFLDSEKSQGQTVFPPDPLIFNALNLTPLDRIKVVILGQDPYIQPGQAMGLSFAVTKGVTVPPSLRNIFRELRRDLGVLVASHGDLTPWARQGVLLLNAILTVRQGLSGSHQGQGWERFTDAIIQHLSDQKRPLVFMLWGKYAQDKGKIINGSRHLILQAGHPSPLSVKRFSGCSHFSKANAFLQETGQAEIDWRLP